MRHVAFLFLGFVLVAGCSSTQGTAPEGAGPSNEGAASSEPTTTSAVAPPGAPSSSAAAQPAAAAQAAPDLSDAPAALKSSAQGCIRGVSVDCVKVGDHYFSNVADGRGRTLYQRAADLDFATKPPLKPGTRTATAVGSAEDALAAARTGWPRLVGALKGDTQTWAKGLSSAVASAPPGPVNNGLEAKEIPCRDGFRWVHQLAHEHGGSMKGAILLGSVDELRRDGSCWSVMFHGGMHREFITYHAPEDGRMLAVTQIPEG